MTAIYQENEQEYIDEDTPGAGRYEDDAWIPISRDEVVSYDIAPDGTILKEYRAPWNEPFHLTELGNVPISDDEDGDSAARPSLPDEEIQEMQRIRGKAERYGEIAAEIAAWNDKVAGLAARVDAERETASAQLRAAADIKVDGDLAMLSDPVIKVSTKHFADVDNGSKHPHKYAPIDVTITIYSCYSFNEKANYYLFKSSGNMNNNIYYYHDTENGHDIVVNSTAFYRSEAWMSNLSADTTAVSLKDNAPENVGDGFTSTKGVTFPLTGSVGLGMTGPTLGLTGGVNISNSTTYTVKDYDTIDCTFGTVPAAEYRFRTPDEEFHLAERVTISDATNAARYNFTSDESWIWSVARSKDDYRFDNKVTYYNSFVRGYKCILPYVPTGKTEYKRRGWNSHNKNISMPKPPTFALTVSQLNVNSLGKLDGDKSVTFGLLSDGPWKIEKEPGCDWVDISKTSSDKETINELISLYIHENTGSDYRKTKLTATGTGGQKSTIEITQDPAPSWTAQTIQVTPDIIEADGKGGQYKLYMYSEVGWSATCDADWVHISPASGDKSGSTQVITVDIDANQDPTAGRSAKISVKGSDGYTASVSVEQEKEPVNIQVSPDLIKAELEGGQYKLNLSSNVDWTSSVEWLAVDSHQLTTDWAHLSPTSGSKSGNTQEIIVDIDENLDPSIRAANIYVKGSDGYAASVFVEQLGKPTIQVSPASIESDYRGGQYKISLLSLGDWNVWCQERWVHFSETYGGATGSTPKEIIVNIDKNQEFGSPLASRDTVIEVSSPTTGERIIISVIQR